MPENNHTPYDPHSRQPQTLGELERWMYACEASKRGRMIPFPVSLDPPPILGLDRLAAYCITKYGEQLSVETVARLIGECALVSDISTEQAKTVSLAEAASLLAPKSLSSRPYLPTNPLHFLIGQLHQFVSALAQYHQATTEDERLQADDALRSIKGPFCATYRIPAEAIRGLADPTLAWLQQKGFNGPEHIAPVENGAGLVTALAAHFPCATPSVYANEQEAQTLWERQGELLLSAQGAEDGLRRLAALTGQAWEWDGRLPWEPSPTTPVPRPGTNQQRPAPTEEQGDYQPDSSGPSKLAAVITIPPCPGCGSLPAADDVDDMCPQCGAFKFRCRIVRHSPLNFGEPILQRVSQPFWERLPPSTVGNSAATSGPIEVESPPSPKPVHNADFTMVNWFGTEYCFALGVQSSAVRAFWKEWELTGLGLHQESIREAIDAERASFRMDTAFRNHPALGPMIKRCGDGRYKLGPPDPEPTPSATRNRRNSKSAPKSRRKRG